MLDNFNAHLRMEVNPNIILCPECGTHCESAYNALKFSNAESIIIICKCNFKFKVSVTRVITIDYFKE